MACAPENSNRGVAPSPAPKRLRPSRGGGTMKNLASWAKHHMAPVAPAYLACLLGGLGLVFAFRFGAPARWFWIGLGLVALPFACAWPFAWFSRADPGTVQLGFFNSYRLTDRQLTFRLCHAVPVFRVDLAEVKSVEPWHGVGPTAFGTQESNLVWFLCSQIWFWPAPLRFMAKILASVQALRCEYAVACESGWVIVLVCSREFANEIVRRANQLRRKTGAESAPAAAG